MQVNTTGIIGALIERVNNILPTTYEIAPTRPKKFPYAVIGSLNISDLESGDLVLFYIDVWTDEKSLDAGVELEKACDNLRNGLYNAIIEAPGIYGHIGFGNQNCVADNEFDIAHRRLSMSARVFYYNE